MANVKIGDLPSTGSLASTDVLPVVNVGGDTTYKITVQNLANSLTQVSSSISASYAVSSSYARTGSYAVTSSYARSASYAANGGVTSIIAGTGISIDTSTGDVTITNTGGGGGSTFPYTGSAIISSSLIVTGSIRVNGSITGSLQGTASLASQVNAASIAGPTSYIALTNTSTAVPAFFGVDSIASLSYDHTTKTISTTSSYSTSASYSTTSSFARTASYVNDLNQNVTITGSLTISGSTSLEVNVLGEMNVTGSLIVSGANGAGVFSQGATLIDYVNTITSTGSYMVWRAPFSCSVVGVYGYYVGGTAPQINAARSGSTGYGRFTASNLTVNAENVWLPITMSGIQNKNLNAGDCLQIIMSGSSNYQLAVQVDFIRKA